MELVLTEDQEMIAETAADFAADRSPISRFRELREAGDDVGFSRALWKEMAELGWLGIAYPESVGGAGMGFAELALVMEQLGRRLAPEPLLSCAVLGGRALLHAGSDAHKKEWLQPLIEGEKLVALAAQEPNSRWSLAKVSTSAKPSGEGWQISGTKSQVLDGHVADAFVVSARTKGDVDDEDGVALFVVPADAPGVEIVRQHRLDDRGAALVHFRQVEIGADALLGDEEAGVSVLERVVDEGTVALCAEMLGGISASFDMTLTHLKERDQFGVKIGTFQGLKHRAARVFMEVELSRSCVMAAARAIDEKSPDAAKLVSLAKARLSDAYVLATNEGVQMFGGVGMTEEYDIGLFMKRARAAELTFGDAAWHRRRWAELSGY
jgi:alkylation response protein AidB-like acyl-CoA dehydrogenase